MDHTYFCTEFFSMQSRQIEPLAVDDTIYRMVANLDKFQAKGLLHVLLTELQAARHTAHEERNPKRPHT